MRYLGKIRGTGMLTRGGEDFAHADYELEGFLMAPRQVVGSGEIRMPPEAMKDVFGRRDVRLRTGNGWLLGLRFSEKSLPPSGDAAHVDVTAGLPEASAWPR